MASSPDPQYGHWWRRWYYRLSLLRQLDYDTFHVEYPTVHNLFMHIGNTIQGLHTRIGDGLRNLWYGAHRLWWGSKWLGFETSLSFYDIYHNRVPHIWRAIRLERKYRQLEIRNERRHRIKADHSEHRSMLIHILSLLKWATLHILGPLLGLIAQVAWQITNHIEPLWALVMHPDRLAGWIFHELITLIEREALWVAQHTTRFFVAFIFHNLRTLVLILEDAIVSVL